jgi:hypothetical protein
VITQQQFIDAISDFEGLIGEGMEPKPALLESAKSNGLDPNIFESRLTREMTLDERVETVRRKYEHDHFMALARGEVAKCRKGEAEYKRLGGFRAGAEEAIIESLGRTLRRTLSEHETWCVEELWSPWMFEVKQHVRFGIKPVHFGKDSPGNR